MLQQSGMLFHTASVKILLISASFCHTVPYRIFIPTVSHPISGTDCLTLHLSGILFHTLDFASLIHTASFCHFVTFHIFLPNCYTLLDLSAILLNGSTSLFNTPRPICLPFFSMTHLTHSEFFCLCHFVPYCMFLSDRFTHIFFIATIIAIVNYISELILHSSS